MKNILIIEDEEFIIQILQVFLTQKGYNVEVVREINLHNIKSLSKNYDVIICDYMMPFFTGFDIYNALDEVDKKKIIILTGGYIDFENEDFLKKAGVTILYKPFHFGELMSKIDGVSN